MISNFALSIGNPLLIVSLFVASVVAIYLCKRRLSEVVEDERIYQVSQKASWATYQIVVLIFAIGGLVLITLRNTHPVYTDLGIFVAHSACGIIVLYSLLYMYYNREYGG
jgi:uncharacterized membrane protein